LSLFQGDHGNCDLQEDLPMESHVRFFIIAVILTVAGCGEKPQPVSVEFRLADRTPAEGLTEMVFSGWGQKDTFYLHNEVLLSEEDIGVASVTTEQESPAVAIRFSQVGTKKFADVTGSNIGRHLGMVVDGSLLSAPLIRDTITVGRAIITGDMSEQEAQRIADGLNRK
jgi:preprotein translocase subunit SecD